MPDEADILYLGHMLDTARKAHAKVRERSREEFDADEDLRLAVTHLIQIIGEAAARVSPECRQAHPHVPWREATGMRNRIVHDYLGVDDDVVWHVAHDDLPQLIAALEAIVPDDGQ